jgi:hypothetical protein
MELNPSRKAKSRSVTQESSNILWNSKVHYHVHKSPPLAPILNQINSVHNIPAYISQIHLNIIRPLSIGLPRGLFLSSFPTNILYAFPFSQFVLHALPNPCSCLDHSNYIWRRVQVMKFYIMQFSSSKYSPQHSVLKHALSVFLS